MMVTILTYISSEEVMRQSYINFFWTGKKPSNDLLTHLLNFQNDLIRNGTEFRVRLWLTDDLYQALSATQSTFPIYIQNIDPLLQQAKRDYPRLFEFYELLHENRLYSFCSSFIRMLILNAEPGLYCDTDIKLKHREDFPQSLESIIAMEENPLETQNSIFAYLNGTEKENQVLLTLKRHAYDERLRKKNAFFEEKSEWMTSFKKDLTVYCDKRAELEMVIATDPFLRTRPYLLIQYLKTIEKKSRTHELSPEIHASEKEQEQKIRESISRALWDFQTFYRLSVDRALTARDTKLNPGLDRIAKIINTYFFNPEQDNASLFTWSHPIHFHLKKVEQRTKPLYRFFRNKISHKKQALNRIISLYSEEKIEEAENLFTLFSKKWMSLTWNELFDIIRILPNENKNTIVIAYIKTELNHLYFDIPSNLIDSQTITTKQKIRLIADHQINTFAVLFAKNYLPNSEKADAFYAAYYFFQNLINILPPVETEKSPPDDKLCFNAEYSLPG